MLPGSWISALGALLLLAGLGVPLWYLYNRTQTEAPKGLKIPDGPLRPEMIRLPDRQLFVARHPVTQANFHRVMNGIGLDVADRSRTDWTACPTPMSKDTLDMPVTCARPSHGIAYARRLTVRENEARAREGLALLTPCYPAENADRPISGCTGYRLATFAEWERAARETVKRADSPKACEPSDSCPKVPKKVMQREPSPWFLYDLDGNIDEMVTVDDAPGRVRVVRGSMRTEQSLSFVHVDLTAPTIMIGFRIVRQDPR